MRRLQNACTDMDRDILHRGVGGETAAQAYQRLLKRWEHHRPTCFTDDEEGWTAHDMVRQLQKDRFSARFIEDIEAVASESELKTVKIEDLIEKLRDWYRPAHNPTTRRYNFHRLTQKDEESFDTFVSKVKLEAKNCHFRCSSVACDVQSSLIRDQIISGITNEDLRRRALREEWNLDRIEDECRSAESAEIFGKFGERLRNNAKISKSSEKVVKTQENDITSKLKDAIDKDLNSKSSKMEKEKVRLFEKVAPRTKANEKDPSITKMKFYDKEGASTAAKSKYHEKENAKLSKSEKAKYLAAKENAKLLKHQEKLSKHYDKEKPKKEGKSKKHCCKCDRDPYNYDHYAAIKIPCHPCSNQRGLCSSCAMCSNTMLENQRRYQRQTERDIYGKKMCHMTDDSCSASDTEDMYKGKSAKAYHVTDESGTPSDTETGEVTDDVFVTDKQKEANKQKLSKMKTVFRLNGRAQRCRRRRRKKTDYKVDIVINEQTVTVTTDTGAEINVLPRHTAETLNLPLQTSEMKISPYGAKPFQVVGKYEGSVKFGSAVVKAKWYIVDKKNIEPLLSGATAEQLGIIKFISKPSEQNSIRRRTEKLTDGTKAKYYLEKLERAFDGLGKLNGYDVELHINENSTQNEQNSETKRNTKVRQCKQDLSQPISLESSFENEINWMYDGANDRANRKAIDTTSRPPPNEPLSKSSRRLEITVDMKRSTETMDDDSDKYVTQQEDIVERRMVEKKLNNKSSSIYD